jgi:hypothetical protein
MYQDRRALTRRPLRDHRRLEDVVAGSELVFPGTPPMAMRPGSR